METWNSSLEDFAEAKAWYYNQHVYTTGITNGPSSKALFLINFNTVTGLVEWASLFDSEYDEEGTSVWGDGTYIYTVGATGSAANGDDLLIVKWNATGGVEWNKTYGSTGYDRGTAVWGNASAIYTAGHFWVGPSNEDALLVAWNPVNGNMFWAETWGGASIEHINAVVGDGLFLYTTGITLSYGAGNFDMCLVKWYSNGTVCKNGTWGRVDGDYGNDLCLLGGAIYVCGSSVLPDTSSDVVLVKWSTSCIVEWDAIWGMAGVSEGVNSMWTNGASFFMCGYSMDGYGGQDGVFVEFLVDGTFASRKTCESTYYCCLNGISGDSSCLYTTGTIDVVGSGDDYDVIFIKWTVGLTITHPGDLAYTHQATGNSISWIVTDVDKTSWNYSLYLDGIFYANGTWTNTTPVMLGVDGLTVGSHAYTIIAMDGQGGIVQDTVIVTVNAAAPPPGVNGYIEWLLLVSIMATLTVLVSKKRQERISCNP